MNVKSVLFLLFTKLNLIWNFKRQYCTFILELVKWKIWYQECTDTYTLKKLKNAPFGSVTPIKYVLFDMHKVNKRNKNEFGKIFIENIKLLVSLASMYSHIYVDITNEKLQWHVKLAYKAAFWVQTIWTTTYS